MNGYELSNNLEIAFSLPIKNNGDPDVEVDEKISEEIIAIEEYAKLYKVIIHNDNYTSMDFVVNILVEIFEKKVNQAYTIMLYVHKNGQAVAGTYSKEIAETKIAIVNQLAKKNEFPLTLTMEKIH